MTDRQREGLTGIYVRDRPDQRGNSRDAKPVGIARDVCMYVCIWMVCGVCMYIGVDCAGAGLPLPVRDRA